MAILSLELPPLYSSIIIEGSKHSCLSLVRYENIVILSSLLFLIFPLYFSYMLYIFSLDWWSSPLKISFLSYVVNPLIHPFFSP